MTAPSAHSNVTSKPTFTASEVRQHLVNALEADLVGPFDRESGEERLSLAPSRYYLTGFLAPESAREEEDPTDADELAAGSDLVEEETGGQEPEPKKRRCYPASMGLTVLLPKRDARTISATVSYADYLDEREPSETGRGGKTVWQRVERTPVTISLPLDAARLEAGSELPESNGIWLVGTLKPTTLRYGSDTSLHALSVFIVNRRGAKEGVLTRGKDKQFIFQVKLALDFPEGFYPRANQRDGHMLDWDDRVSDLQFRSTFEYAVGHGVSAYVDSTQTPVTHVETRWLPHYEVKPVVTRDAAEAKVIASMEALSVLKDGSALEVALSPLVQAYGAWISEQAVIEVGSEDRTQTKTELIRQAERAKERIARGISILASDEACRRAFCWMNQAMAQAALKRNPERYTEDRRPSWRLFQLAFVLLNIEGLSDDASSDRDTAELIYFPTGGGKTEAYLGVIAFTLILRRQRGMTRPDQGLGVAILLRYTLRLLTLDQLGRAATLICALELVRQNHEDVLGRVRFSVGLWVGRSATANTMKEVRKKIDEYKNSTSLHAPSPLPLSQCPWCGEALGRDSLSLRPPVSPTEVVISCANFKSCEFSTNRNREGLPVLFVDEQIYRELPCFIVGTVDKFAMLPWRGETGMLFGNVCGFDGRSCYGPMDSLPKQVVKTPQGFFPPELIIQDELHLISGPLGSMVGLYETAIELLCTRREKERKIKPKLIASTATVKRAKQQVLALFGRSDLAVFPPSGVDDSETYFARVDHNAEGRLYVGVAASGRATKAILLRTYASMLAAAQAKFDEAGDPNQGADPYRTVVGYFNSLRELGGMRRLVEDEVRVRVSKAEDRAPLDRPKHHPWYRNLKKLGEPVELTSRESTSNVATIKARLGLPATNKEHVDVLLASNMISVGVDIDRLGLMIIAGQPKTTSEYIQASSRVGRLTTKPGLVLTCFNVYRPRDRSHYERFAFYHETFYRAVEATSVTPFSGPALDRGLAGVLLAMMRLSDVTMTPPQAAMLIDSHTDVGKRCVTHLGDRFDAQVASRQGDSAEMRTMIEKRADHLIDDWRRLVKTARDEQAAQWTYSPYDHARGDKALLFTANDDGQTQRSDIEKQFSAPTSMRDVEDTVHLWLERKSLGGKQ